MPFIKRCSKFVLIGVFFLCLAAPFQAGLILASSKAEPVALEGPPSIKRSVTSAENNVPAATPATQAPTQAGTTTIVSPADSSILPKPHLWLHVDAISEGMANWRIGFVELLLVAKEIGAVLVEPCVQQGKVVSCHTISNPKKLRVGQVFDLAKLRRDIHPWIVSQEEYEADTASVDRKNKFVFCMHHGSPSASVICIRNGGLLNNYHSFEKNDALEQAVQQSQPAVIEIHTYRKRGFTETKLGTSKHPLVNATLLQQVLDEKLVFHPSHYEIVNGFLKQLGVDDNNYNVLHWRAELRGINYPACADKLVKSKDIMSQNNNSIPTILISSLNQSPFLQWGGVGSGASTRSSAPVLASLLSNGFLKLDSIKEKGVSDMLYLAIWDQILARGAAKFATCTKACNKKQACSLCNYRGSFGEVVMGLRRRLGKESLTCWPTK
jgi:hypothetical protein